MLIFDMHTHCFPDALAPKALPRLAEISRCAYHGDGTYGSLCEEAAAAGCAGFMILHIATKPSQMTSVNNFAAACQKGNAYCFGSVYPTAENAVDELHRIKALGLKGVKFHPDYQEFFVDDPAVFPVYEAAAALGLPAWRRTVRIILPQALRTILPSGFNEIISLAKGTAMVYVLAMP